MKPLSVHEAPESIRKIIEAMVRRTLVRCDTLGIDRGDFYRAMLEEAKLGPGGDVPGLFERTFRRLSGRSN